MPASPSTDQRITSQLICESRFRQSTACSSLERELENARAHIELLEREIAVGANGNAVFRKVGLSESCPEFVIKAVRTAYRKQLHPDGHPSHLKPEAERCFKEAEAAFDQIRRIRDT